MARSLGIACFIALTLSVAALGCGSAAPPPPPPKPPEAPPTPTSVTKANPGGDAADPERAALMRLLSEPWGNRKDRWNTLLVPLVDWKNWRRVRLWGHPTRATYRYGDKHSAVDTTLYTPIEGANDPDTCLAKFMEYATTTAQAYGVHLGKEQLVRTTQVLDDGTTQPLVIKLLEGSIDAIFASNDYVGAVAVYQSWPGTCLVRGFAVVSTNHRELALKVRDRWVSEGASTLRWEKRLNAAPPTEAK